MLHYRCNKLHLTITLKDCEALRKRPQWGGQANCGSGGPGRPPQCNGCEDWMQWDESNGQELTRFEPKAKGTPTPQEGHMTTKKVGLCAGCGLEKTLLSKTHCHQCVKNQKKDEPKTDAAPASRKVALDFAQDIDILDALVEAAHLNYRTLPSEILATLRLSMESGARPLPGTNPCDS